MAFGDKITLTIGDERITVRRMTIKEIRDHRAIFAEGRECLDETYTKLIAEHCTTADGKPLDATALSLPQLARIAKELAGVPEGNPLSDFIGLLC